MAQQSYSGQGRVIAEVWRSHTFRQTTLGRTPLEEGSSGRRDLYLTTHHTHLRHTSTPSAGFEPTIPASEWPQTHALDRAATGNGLILRLVLQTHHLPGGTKG